MSRASFSPSTVLRQRPVQVRRAYSTSSSSSPHASSTSSHDLRTSDPNDSQKLRMESGRTLGFATYGPEAGFPLLFFHGFPSSRLEASVLRETAANRHLRVISIDRPGFGLSTLQPGRLITDWPADVAAVVQHLGLRRYSILGASGGGPFALACAHALPKEQMVSVGVFASGGPWAAGTKDLPLESRALGWVADRYPRVLQAFMTAMVGMARWLLHTRFVARWLDRTIEPEVKQEQSAKEPSTQTTEDTKNERAHVAEQQDIQLVVGERRQQLIRMLLEAFTQGTAGLVREAQLLSSMDWGFRFEDVAYDKVQIWHGTKDSRSPISQIRYMAERLPHAELTEFDEQGHFDMAKKIDEALDRLIPEDAATK